ncbi:MULTISPECIES: hypothetical protein [unclassified Lentimicrobium]|uniref:hypothetical protein n=1 Tax=unclassified Lentimicrobium TaxID=2677434 RepID=UPI001552099F|nr:MULTISPECIES: hypothetical protein [unclassified Lentimicrobium]NPD46414.1 hypothetical protein [Lentimicrobium sp. S6]NPD84945.1 hypothetical protein [Lentimicrobium sp. L6]
MDRNGTFFIPFAIIVLTHTNEEISANPFLKGYSYLMIPLVVVCGAYKVVDSYETHMKKHGPISSLTLSDKAIELFNKEFTYSNLQHITIRLRDEKVQPLHSANNYLKIETFNDTYELALVIDSKEDLETVKKAVAHFKSKDVSIIFKNIFLKTKL